MVLTQLLKWLLVASLIGCGSYAFWRWYEMKTVDTDWAVLLDVLSIFAGLLLSVPLVLLVVMDRAFLLPIGSLALGAWLHQRSGGASRGYFMACILISMSLFGGFIVSGLIYLLLETPFSSISIQIGPYEIDEFGLYFGTCWLYTVLSPLALLIWRSLRVRPGVDVPLN